MSYDDGREAREARDEALERVSANADPRWKALAERGIRYLAERQTEMTADDVWALLEKYRIALPHEKRAMGPILVKMGKEGVIQATSRSKNSVRKVHHAAPVRIWRSCRYGATQHPFIESDKVE